MYLHDPSAVGKEQHLYHDTCAYMHMQMYTDGNDQSVARLHFDLCVSSLNSYTTKAWAISGTENERKRWRRWRQELWLLQRRWGFTGFRPAFKECYVV